MKKLLNTLLVLIALAGTFMLTGCANDLDEILAPTYDTWYKYTKTTNLAVANADSNDASKDGVLKNAQLYVRFNPDDGIEILVCTSQEQTISYLGGAYNVKADVVTGGSKKYSASEFGRGKWYALICLGSFVKEEPPTITVNLDNFLEGQFNLKRVLAEFLLNTLLK